jgi:hypothetical protein
MQYDDLSIVERVLLLYSKPGRWTQKVLARDREGRPVAVFSSDARCFDLEGAIRRAAGVDDRESYARFVKRSFLVPKGDDSEEMKRVVIPGPLAKHIEPFKNPFDWNDQKGRKQKDVVLMLEDLADELRYVS